MYHLHLIAFHGASSVERKRFTQHSFKALSNAVKSVMFRPPSSLHFMIVDFLILGCLYFQMNLKIILLTSSVKPSGVLSTLKQMSLGDQMLRISCNDPSLS